MRLLKLFFFSLFFSTAGLLLAGDDLPGQNELKKPADLDSTQQAAPPALKALPINNGEEISAQADPKLDAKNMTTECPRLDPVEVSLHLDVVSWQAGLVTSFLLPPSWACHFKMGPLPDCLKPMGKKSETEEKQIAATAAAATQPEKPLTAISPFLQWIQSNPQAAAEAARQQSSRYQNTAGAQPYWVPPSNNGAVSTDPTASSSATYERPER